MASATHRQTGWGLHQRRWSNNACATPQRRPRHELAWIWTDFLSEQRRATDLVKTAIARAAGRAANDSLHDVRPRLKISSQLVSWQRSFCTVAYARMHERICIFCGEYVCIHRCCIHHSACAGVYVRHVLWASAYKFASRSLQDVHIRSSMCSLFYFALGERGWGVSASLWKYLLLDVGGYFW